MELKHLKKTLTQKENTVRVQDVSHNKNQQQYNSLLKEVNRIKEQQSKFDYEDGAFESLRDRKESLNVEMQQLKRQLDQRNASRYQLHYRDPEPGFDRSKVRGMAGKLFTVSDEQYCFALLMAGGGSVRSIYNVQCKLTNNLLFLFRFIVLLPMMILPVKKYCKKDSCKIELPLYQSIKSPHIQLINE